MEVEPCSGAQLVELEEDGVVLGPQENVHLDDYVGALAKITLYALVGNPSTQTMRVKGRIKNHKVVSLIDSRSTQLLGCCGVAYSKFTIRYFSNFGS